MPTPSNKIPLHTKASAFRLLDAQTNEYVSFPDQTSKIATVVMFLCNHCPYVQHILPKLIEVANLYQNKNISFIAISSNDVNAYPEDSFANMRLEAKKKSFPFPYLFDETQSVAMAYHAACTPDFYVFDKELKCVYHGQFDDSTPGNKEPVTGSVLSHALDQILIGQPVGEPKPSLGCSIKWSKENAS